MPQASSHQSLKWLCSVLLPQTLSVSLTQKLLSCPQNWLQERPGSSWPGRPTFPRILISTSSPSESRTAPSAGLTMATQLAAKRSGKDKKNIRIIFLNLPLAWTMTIQAVVKLELRLSPCWTIPSTRIMSILLESRTSDLRRKEFPSSLLELKLPLPTDSPLSLLAWWPLL